MIPAMQNSTTQAIRRANRRNIFRYIHWKGPVSRQEIASALQLSMPTVLQNVRELMELALIQEVGQYQSTGGRKPVTLAIVPQARLCAGIDLTQNHVGLVLVDLAGNLLCHQRVSLPFRDREEYFRKIGELLQNFLQQYAVDQSRLLGVGISIPGILNPGGSMITDSHALKLKSFPCEKISHSIPWDCQFVNDANAAGVAELRLMEPDSTMAYLSLSNSVGGAFFLHGQLYEGNNQRSSEFGHIRLYPDGKSCYCGQKGCLDAYCSALVLERAAGGRLEQFFQKLEQKDPAAEAVWEEYLHALSLGLVNLRMAYDCTVIPGGYVGAFLTPYFPRLRQLVAEMDPFGGDGSFLRPCQYQYEASAFGAALLPIHRFLERF